MTRHRPDIPITKITNAGVSITAVITVAVMVALVLAGCGKSSPDKTAEPVVIDITLSGSTTTPSGKKIDVSKGQQVMLTVNSDHDDQVHVHGSYGVELPVTSGKAASTSFVAD